MNSIHDPATLIEREDIQFEEKTRSFDQEKFEALRDRYDSIAGVVQVGVVNENDDVLLLGPDEWVPPGGDVEVNEDWVTAARRAIDEWAGIAVDIDEVKLVELTNFHANGDDETQFSAYVVTFQATLANDNQEFLDEPTTAEDLNHKYVSDGEAVELAWFGEMPKDVHENHERHVRIFIEE